MGRLEAQHPALQAHTGHRLADLHPYVLPEKGEVVLFTCRWNTEAPLGVWISSEFDERERALAETALDAWQDAGLGLRFLAVREDEASLALEIADDPVETAAGTGSGRAVVDCALASRPAQLVFARVEVARRLGPDALGRHRAMSDTELLGTLVHELGHALGFQGHARRRNSVMSPAPEDIVALGRRIQAGEAIADPSLAALYALPSGTVLARVPVAPWRTDLVDRMAALAAAEHLDGPFARVGDRTARIFWRDTRAGRIDEYGLQVMNLDQTLRRPEKLLVGAEILTRGALPRSRDRGPGG